MAVLNYHNFESLGFTDGQEGPNQFLSGKQVGKVNGTGPDVDRHIELSTDFARIGTKSLKVTLERGIWRDGNSNGPLARSEVRTNIFGGNPGVMQGWFSFSFLAAILSTGSTTVVIAQLWDGGSPSISFRYRSNNNQVFIRIHNSDQGGNTDYHLFYATPNTWNDVDFWYQARTNNTGRFKAWVNGSLLHNITRQTIYSPETDSSTPYWKLGAYDSGFGGENINELRFYFDAVSYHDDAGSEAATLGWISDYRNSPLPNTKKSIYVRSSGSNASNGLSIASPVQTRQHALSLAGPGDRILCHSGDVFTGQLSQNKSGIEWDVYGGSNRPVFSGFVTLTGWTSQGNGIWSCTNAALGSTLKKVTVNGAGKACGRWPKFNAVDHGFLTISSGSTTSLSNSAIGTGPNFVGGELCFKTSLYTCDIVNITGQSGSTLNFSGNLSYGAAKNGYGFFVQNHASCLSEIGEWAYNGSTKTISMYFGASSPNSYQVRASSANNLVSAGGGITEVQFSNIIMEGSNGDGAHLGGANTFQFDNVALRQIGGDGVNAANHHHLSLLNCHFHDINNNAAWTTVGSSYARAENCLVEDIGLDIGMTKGGLSTGGGYGLHLPWGNTLIRRNTVRRVAGVGIRYEKAYSQCLENTVHDVLQRFADLGGIYNWNGSTNLDKQPGMKCTGNMVYNIFRCNHGTTYGNAMLAHGIYQDDHSAGHPDSLHEIRGNSVWNIDGNGFNLRNVESMSLTDNLAFNCDNALRIVSDTSGSSPELIEDLHSRGNIFVAKTAGQAVLGLYDNHGTLQNWVSSPANWNNNILARPIDEGNTVRTQNGGGVSNRTFEGWKALLGWDADSKKSPVTISNVDRFRFEPNTGDTPITIDLGDGTYIDMHGETQQAFVQVPARTAGLLIKTGDTAPAPGNPTVEINTLVSGSRYIYPATIEVGAIINASGSVAKVEFFDSSGLVATVTSAPWNTHWVPAPGSHTLHAAATDSGGRTGESEPVSIEVHDFMEAGAFHLRLNAGTGQDVAYQGNTFYGDSDFVGLYSPTLEDNVSPDTQEPIFLTGRAAEEFSCRIPVRNGTYTVKTFHNEPWFGLQGPSAQAGRRVFDISINNALVRDGFDIFLESGNQNTVLDFGPVTVTDGFIELDLVASSDKANLSGLEIYPYIQPTYMLTVSVHPAQGGTAAPGGEYEAGTVVQLTAVPSPGWVFVNWTRGGSVIGTGASLNYVTGGQAETVQANFIRQQYMLTVTAGQGGAVSAGGQYESGTSLVLTATPQAGYVFQGWYRGGVLLGSGTAYTYTTRGQADTVEGRFLQLPQAVVTSSATSGFAPLTVRFTGSGSTADMYLWNFGDGSVSQSPDPEHTFAAGTYTVTLTVIRNGMSASSTRQITATVPPNAVPAVQIISPVNLSANFTAPATIPVTVAASDPDGTINRVEFYVAGEKIGESLTAPFSFAWPDVPVGTYQITARAFDDEGAFSDSYAVQVTVYNPLLGYMLNGKLLAEYGIIPAQAPGSNLAIEGAWDMPARTGKVYHEWPDQDGVEPYLRADELFYAGRDIVFHGLIRADSEGQAQEKLLEMYGDIDASTSVVTFSCEFGSWQVHVLRDLKAESLGNGWYDIEIPFRQPSVDLSGTVLEGDSGAFGIDGLPWGELGLILLETTDAAYTPGVRQAETSVYGREGIGVKKRGLKEFKLRFVLQEDTYAVFASRIQTLYSLFSAPGARTMRLEDGTYREVFIKDGFQVIEVLHRQSRISAVLEITVAQIRQLTNWNILTNDVGDILADGQGRPLNDLLKWF